MNVRRTLLYLFLSLGRPAVAAAQASLLVTSDLSCTWKLDGKTQGQLKADDATVIKVSPGKHLVQAISTHGTNTFRSIVEVNQGQELVEIKLKMAKQNQPASAGGAKRSTIQSLIWTDPETGLMWPLKDNGLHVTWEQAGDYCRNLSLQSYTDWRLPSPAELKGIYDPNSSSQLKGGIRPSDMQLWSNYENRSDGYRGASVLNLAIGLVENKPADSPRFGRALCVRNPGK